MSKYISNLYIYYDKINLLKRALEEKFNLLKTSGRIWGDENAVCFDENQLGVSTIYLFDFDVNVFLIENYETLPQNHPRVIELNEIIKQELKSTLEKLYGEEYLKSYNLYQENIKILKDDIEKLKIKIEQLKINKDRVKKKRETNSSLELESLENSLSDELRVLNYKNNKLIDLYLNNRQTEQDANNGVKYESIFSSELTL